VRVWDVRRGEAVRSLQHPALVLGLSLSASGSLLASAGGDGSARTWQLDWEPDAEAVTRASVAVSTTGARATVTRHAVPATEPPGPTVREELRRTAPPARRVPWRLVGAAALALAALATAVVWLRRPPQAVALSAHVTRSVTGEQSLIDLAPFLDGCRPGDYEQHLDALRAGQPSARDVACVAAAGGAGVVDDVLDGAPLSDADALTSRRRRRNAASALAGLAPEAAARLCLRLGNPSEDVRDVAAAALGAMPGEPASACVTGVLASGPGAARLAAAEAARQRLARGLVAAGDGWALAEGLLRSAEPDARRAGLRLLPLFPAARSAPAAEALLQDADPDVATAARQAADEIESARRSDPFGDS
jgi:hypothetical protein